MQNNKNGFTLIELLVVVLIIGILAAVALPQYKKAVEKSRSAQAFTLLKALGQAQEEYYMANGAYADNFEALSVSLPASFVPGGTFYNYQTKDRHTNGEWVISISVEDGIEGGILIGHPAGHAYQGAGLVYRTANASRNVSQGYGGKISCMEVAQGVVFQRNIGDFCQKIFHATNAICTSAGGCAVNSWLLD